MKRVIAILLLAFLAAGCAASRGEGITVGNGLINTGASQAARDQVVRERTQAEIANTTAQTQADIEEQQKRTEASIEQGRETGKVSRVALLALAMAAAIACLWIGGGHALQRATPMASQGVKALETALELRKAKRLEVRLEIGPGGYSGHLLAEGYTHNELADLIRQNPALDAPRLQQLQTRVGAHGMRALADTGELETTLALLPNQAEGR